jgi:hypothetical protein
MAAPKVPVTVEDAQRAVRNGSYKTLADSSLEELLGACAMWSMTNDAEKHLVDSTAAAIRTELSSREESRRHKATQRVAWWAFCAAVASVVATVALWAIDHWNALSR